MNILLKLWKNYVPYDIGDLFDIYDKEGLPLSVRHHILAVSEGAARLAKTLMRKGYSIKVRILLEGVLYHEYKLYLYHATVHLPVKF